MLTRRGWSISGLVAARVTGLIRVAPAADTCHTTTRRREGKGGGGVLLLARFGLLHLDPLRSAHTHFWRQYTSGE